MKTGKGVFGLGQCSLDCVGLIREYPPADSKCEVSSMVIQGGGPVATALAALSRWGVPCSICGVTGDDVFGNMIRRSLSEELIGHGKPCPAGGLFVAVRVHRRGAWKIQADDLLAAAGRSSFAAG